MREMHYLVPQEQLFRLLEVCSNSHFCGKRNKDHCICRNLPKELSIKPVDTSIVDRHYSYMV